MVDNNPVLTVIIPCYNEGATIEALLRRVMESPYSKQILVVDDGSTDETAALLNAWRDRRDVQILTHRRNQGKGAAIRTALQFATGKYTIVQDGDLETDPRDYPKLIEPLLEDRADFVIGSRFLQAAPDNRRGGPYRWGVNALNLFVRILYGLKITDEACCYKALPTDTLQAMNLRCQRFEFCPEVVAKASRLGLRIVEVAIQYHPRSRLQGKKIRLRDGVQALWTLWRFRRWSGARITAAQTTPAPQAPAPHTLAPCNDASPKLSL